MAFRVGFQSLKLSFHLRSSKDVFVVHLDSLNKAESKSNIKLSEEEVIDRALFSG